MNENLKKSFFTATIMPELVTLQPSKYIEIGIKVPAESREALLAIAPLYMLSSRMMAPGSNTPMDVQNPLEGTWSLIDKTIGFLKPSNIVGNFMIQQPDASSQAEFDSIKAELMSIHHQKDFFPYLVSARFRSVEEQLAVKMLHIGPYTMEQESFDKMEDYAARIGVKRKHSHHSETYLKDLRTVTSEQFETILKFEVQRS